MVLILVILTLLMLPALAIGEEKSSLMMAPLQAIDVSTGEAAILTDALLNSLVRTGAFQAVERRDLKELLTEMALSLSDIMNQDTSTLEPGQIQSAQVACLGTVGKIGDYYVLQARCADIKTGMLIGSSSLRCNGSIDCLLDLTDRAARELAGLPPGPSSTNSVTHESADRVLSNSDPVYTPVPSGKPIDNQSQWHIITNAEFARFIKAGGYTTRTFWSDSGWQFRRRNNLVKPAFWNNPNLNLLSQPITGISYYEAEAFCIWRGSRLPGVTEALECLSRHESNWHSDKFCWTNEPSDMGHDCVSVIRNGRKTFSQKDIRSHNTGLVAGGAP